MPDWNGERPVHTTEYRLTFNRASGAGPTHSWTEKTTKHRTKSDKQGTMIPDSFALSKGITGPAKGSLCPFTSERRCFRLSELVR